MLVPVGDVALWVLDTGGDGQPIVLLHGGPGLDHSEFFPGLDPLTSDYRLLAVDHRGNGRSQAGDPARWTVDQMADDVEALFAALRLQAPVLLGHSFGSFVAQAHLARHGTAQAYVLAGTVAEPSALLQVPERLARFEPLHLREQVARSWALEASVTMPEECARLWADQIPFQVADPEGPLVAELQRRAASIVYRPEVLRHFASGGEYGLVDRRAELACRNVPVLVLSGELDRTCDPRSAHALAETLADAEEVLIAGAAHMLFDEAPEQSLAALKRFLSRVCGTSRAGPA